MSKQEYTQEQIQLLLDNPNVKACSSKYITFTDAFKVKALELGKVGFYPKKIFEETWFPEFVVNSQTPKQSLTNWRSKMKHKGLPWLINTQKWRKKKEVDKSKMTKDEYIRYLETKTAYLEELNKKVSGYFP